MTAPGGTTWQVNADLVKDPAGTIIGLIETRLDITERNRAEVLLRESQAKYSSIVERSNDGIIVLQEGKVVFANAAMARMSGTSVGEALGRPFLDFVAPGHKALVADNYRRRLSGEALPDRYEIELIGKDGKNLSVEVNASQIEHEGKPAVMAIVRDITESKQADEALRAKTEELNAYFAGALDMLCIADTDGYFRRLNKAWESTLGYSLNELEGHRFLDLVHPDDLNATLQAISVLDAQNPVLNFVNRYRCKDGSYKWIEWHSHPSGRLIHAVARDITDKKLAEEALRESEERYQMLIAASPDGIVTVGMDGLISFASSQVAELFAYQDVTGIVGHSPMEWVRSEDRERAGADFRNLFAGGHVVRNPYSLNKKDGTSFWAEINNSPVKDGQGRQTGIISIIRDVTERKLAEDRFRIQKEVTDGVLANSPNAVVVLNTDHRILYINNAFKKSFNCTNDGTEGRALGDILPIESLTQAISRVVTTGQQQDLEFRHRTADEERIFVAHVLLMKEQAGLLLIILRDVTAERAVQLNAYHSAALATIGEMASGIAHELNNPLTSVVGFSELAAAGKGLPEETKRHLEIIHKESLRSARIVQSLLIFARKTPMEKLPVAINEVVSNVLQLRNNEHKLNSIVVKTQLGAGLPEVCGNSSQLQQVFLNIVMNAEYFMKEAHGRGTLTVVTERSGDVVRFTCTDDGPGIPKEIAGRLFTPFFTTKPVGKGTGLGLGISHGIITEHGGRIFAESTPGKGATFVVELPVLKSGEKEGDIG